MSITLPLLVGVELNFKAISDFFIRVLLPVGFLVIVAVNLPAWLGDPQPTFSPVFQAYLVGFSTFLATLALFFAYFADTIKNWAAMVFIMFAGVILIVIFAEIYAHFTLVYSGNGNTTIDKFTYVYFSIVTFTTLGYGDFHPTEEIRLIAAMQAIMGYIYLGFIVGAVHHMGSKPSETSVSQDKTNTLINSTQNLIERTLIIIDKKIP